jgi:hypothetical protein
MLRTPMSWAAAAAVLLATGGVAHAQYYYPPGYGHYGWGGWGGGETIAGNQARGMGVFAAGAGSYNVQTAQARSINANTAMQWNQYIYESTLEAGRINREKQAQRRNLINETADTTFKRLRDNPTEADIMNGNAMNVALDEITNPRVYARALRGAKLPLPGTVIREIPFNYASAALTVSVDNLTKDGPPALLKGPEFDADRAALRAVAQKIRAQADEEQPIDGNLVSQAQAMIKAIDAKIVADPDKYRRFSPPVDAARNYLKGLYGLLSMLETPAINVLLAGVEKRPDTTLGDLLSFMQSFNLRFGPTKTPQQRAIYAQIYPALDGLRDEINNQGVASSDPGRPSGSAPAEFFSGMDYQHLDAKRSPPAPAPNQ